MEKNARCFSILWHFLQENDVSGLVGAPQADTASGLVFENVILEFPYFVLFEPLQGLLIGGRSDDMHAVVEDPGGNADGFQANLFWFFISGQDGVF